MDISEKDVSNIIKIYKDLYKNKHESITYYKQKNILQKKIIYILMSVIIIVLLGSYWYIKLYINSPMKPELPLSSSQKELLNVICKNVHPKIRYKVKKNNLWFINYIYSLIVLLLFYLK